MCTTLHLWQCNDLQVQRSDREELGPALADQINYGVQRANSGLMPDHLTASLSAASNIYYVPAIPPVGHLLENVE